VTIRWTKEFSIFKDIPYWHQKAEDARKLELIFNEKSRFFNRPLKLKMEIQEKTEIRRIPDKVFYNDSDLY
jgi:hypothetical protein